MLPTKKFYEEFATFNWDEDWNQLSSHFEDYLKQVMSVYPHLDLSKVTIDDPQSSTPAGGDTINEEIEDSIQSERDP